MTEQRDFRGTSEKGLTRARERNVPLGNVVELVPGRLYNIVGFDIGKANVSKSGIREGLEKIVQEVRNNRDPLSSIRIIGHASESRLPGRGAEAYERDRAAALKEYLVHTTGISRSRIETRTSGPRSLPASAYSPQQKAVARSATVEIIPSLERRTTEGRFTDNSTYAMGEPNYHSVARGVAKGALFTALVGGLKAIPNPYTQLAGNLLALIGVASMASGGDTAQIGVHSDKEQDKEILGAIVGGALMGTALGALKGTSDVARFEPELVRESDNRSAFLTQMRLRARQLELAADPKRGPIEREGAGGVRLEQAGRKLVRSSDAAIDFIDKVLGPVSLKGPIPPQGTAEGLAMSVIKDVLSKTNTATKAVFVDLTGLSAAGRATVRALVEKAIAGKSTKPIYFLYYVE